MGAHLRTFLMTDIEGSTQAWERDPATMASSLALHDRVLREVIESHRGVVFKHTGDGAAAVFDSPIAAVECGIDLQRRLAEVDWGDVSVRVRAGAHTGEAESRDGDWFGPTLNRCARLMDAGHGGQFLISAATGELVRGEDPSIQFIDHGAHPLRGVAAPVEVFQVVAEGLETDFPPLRTRRPTSTNLPVERSEFVGRERELAELAVLQTTHRLVTLTGVGGVGKTRLALRLASDQVGSLPDGVWWTELAAVADPELVPQVLADVVGLRLPGAGERSVSQDLVRFLGQRRLLLVLDNCEHLLDAVADLTDGLLSDCPSVRIIATSREPLGVQGELVWRVPSMGTGLEHDRSEAIDLFAARAAEIDRDFELTADRQPTVAKICRRLDGIPLAIELAAALVGHLEPVEIAERLDDRFRLLTGGHRRAPQRQATLTETLAWSWDLLGPADQVFLARLSVFAGTFGIEAVAGICTEDRDDYTALDRIRSLVDRSLVEIIPSGHHTRYRLLETVRLYAREQLRQRGETQELLSRHAAWYTQWVEEQSPILGHAAPALEPEIDNLRQALDWSFERSDLSSVARLAIGTTDYWFTQNQPSEGRRWLRVVEPAIDRLTPEQRAGRLAALATLGLVDISPHCWDSANEALAADPDEQARSSVAARIVRSYTLRFLDTAAAMTEIDLLGRHPLLQEDPDWPVIAAFYRSMSRLMAGEFEAARHGFQSVTQSGSADPFTDLFSRLFAAWALVLEGQPDRGLAELEQLEDDLPHPSPFVLDLYLHLLHALALGRVNRVDDALDHVAMGLAIWERDYAHLEIRLMYPLAAAMLTAQTANRTELAAFLHGFSQRRAPLLIEMLVPILDEIDQIGATLDAETRSRCLAEGAAAEVGEVVARINAAVA